MEFNMSKIIGRAIVITGGGVNPPSLLLQLLRVV
nr:MAG TPA: hypothetical protein [Caudoviricetes sp.]